MKYYLDCEFNGLGGALLSLALVREDGPSYYVVFEHDPLTLDPWVAENVVPLLYRADVGGTLRTREQAAREIAHYLRDDPEPLIIADWPDDIKYLCELMIVGSLYWDLTGGPMFELPTLTFQAARVDAYPTALRHAVQHNAWWDAMALRAKLAPPTETER